MRPRTSGLLVFVMLLLVLPTAAGHGVSNEDVFVRVVSADPATRTYTFSCTMEPDNDFPRDWFIRPDTGTTVNDGNEAEFLDVPSSEHLTYTFEEDRLYHVGCLIVSEPNFENVYRGDMHIDLRTSGWDPGIVSQSGDGLTSTLACEHSDPGLPSWSVVNAQTGEHTGLGDGETITHSVTGHGLYDYICSVGGTSTGLPVEYFDQGDPYFPDGQGVPHGIQNSWVRDGDQVCGNGVVESGETCDDGNTDSGDGCSSTCQIEDGQACVETVHGLPVECTAGNITDDTASGSCRTVICSDGDQAKACDKDGYFEVYSQVGDGDVCFGDTCLDGWGYKRSSDYPYCFDDAVCGNGIVESEEQCDDGNTDSGDGCSSMCQLEGDEPVCGNGVVETGEACDDGNTDSGDGCSSMCQLEGDEPVCGNGVVESEEQCDDGNTVDGDGCSSMCQLESDDPVCGNGVIESGEQCDDGNTDNGDGCSSTCQTEDNQQACYSDVNDIPAECSGTITEDTSSGSCRTIVCEGMQVLACNKPDGSAEYFEMYRQTESGGAELCLAGTCISDNGWAKSGQYPVCVDDGGVDDNEFPIVWIEPAEGQTGTSPTFFHLNVEVPSGESQIPSTQWEVWDATERVWSALNNTGDLRFHTHAPDGIFEGSRAGTGSLAEGSEYKVRIRYRFLNGSFGPWSTWRTFSTSTAQTGGNLTWTAAEGFKVERFATDLDVPVHLALAPQGMYDHVPEDQRPYLYVTELYGKVKVLTRDGTQSVYADGLLNFEPFGSITGGGQMGVIGLYVDDTTGDLFVGMVYVENDTVKNKVVRFFSTDDGRGSTGSQVLIDDLPSSPSHQVQQITRGPDGKLYVQLGDALNENHAQDDSVLAGKIIRMNLDGSDVETYAKGFRNPFGGDWRPGTGQLFVTDNSPDTNDRLLRVEEGGNYKWGTGSQDYVDEAIWILNVSPVDVEFNPGGNTFPDGLTGKMYVAVAGPTFTEGPTEGKEILEFSLNSAGDVASARHLVRYTGTGYGTPIGLEFGDEGLYFTDIYGEPGFIGLGETEANVYLISPGEPGDCPECTGEFRAGISVAKWYPKDTGNGIAYIFECRGIDGSGDYRYDWHFGDGNKLLDTTLDGVYREYPYGDQDYSVSCTAHDQGTGESASAGMVINPADFIEG